MAWIGIIIGGFTVLTMICFVIVIISLFRWHPGTFPLPPMFDKYQIWVYDFTEYCTHVSHA
jgi:hypothetical protein